MGNNGYTAMKVIVVVGVLAFFGLLLLSVLLKQSIKPNPRHRVVIRTKYSPFDSGRAFADLEKILGFGPRPAGSEASAEVRRYLKRELAGAGLKLREYAFEAETPVGKRQMVNLTATVRGSRPGLILLSNHYDTKLFEDFAFVGANDGGSTTAWMLEMARMYGPEREGRSVQLAWFDGEESFGPWSAVDGLYGSRAFVEGLREAGTLDTIDAMINVDMIGDCYLHIFRDKQATPWLEDVVWEKARNLGYGAHFSGFARGIEDDHVPFRQAGIPCLELIDFSYGGSVVEHRKNWHTANDTVDKVCAESLQAVADVLYHAVPAIERHLDSQEKEGHDGTRASG